MNKLISIAAMAFVAVSTLTTTPAFAQRSCYDLWYARNLIYANNGYCFRTRLAIRTFGNTGCYTRNPRFSRAESRRIARIQREERIRGCRVNR